MNEAEMGDKIDFLTTKHTKYTKNKMRGVRNLLAMIRKPYRLENKSTKLTFYTCPVRAM
jgi:hypothetical protein